MSKFKHNFEVSDVMTLILILFALTGIIGLINLFQQVAIKVSFDEVSRWWMLGGFIGLALIYQFKIKPWLEHKVRIIKAHYYQWRSSFHYYRLTRRWNRGELANTYGTLEKGEKIMISRIHNLKRNNSRDHKQKQDYESILRDKFIQQTTVEKTKNRVKMVDQAISKRENAIRMYKSIFPEMKLYKRDIERARQDFFSGGCAEFHVQEARDFIEKINDLIIDIEGELEVNRYENNFMSIDEPFNFRGLSNQLENQETDSLDLKDFLQGDLDWLKPRPPDEARRN